MILNNSNINGVSTVQPRLKPWGIYDVTFKGVTYREFAGKKDPNAKYQTMEILFEGKDGIYRETVWCPREGDDKRNDLNGKLMPSRLETLQFLLAHIGMQLAPKGYEKFKGVSWDLPTQFQKMCEAFEKITKPAVGTTIKLKLIGNKKGEATLPFFVNINGETGESYISNNFLGDKVFFSTYEISQQEKLSGAKPTEMKDTVDDDVDGADTDADDMEFEV